MSLSKRVLVTALCFLVLASTASAALTKMTMAELRGLIKKYQPAAGAVPSPDALLKKLQALKGPGASPVPAPIIMTDRAYGASLLVSESLLMPFGIGVGELGDYVLINDAFWGDVWAFQNGGLKFLFSSPGDYATAGRMYGRYYFGDFAANIFRLEHDGSITSIFTEIGVDGVLVSSLAIEPTHGWLAFSLLFDIEAAPGAPQPSLGSLVVIIDPSNPEIGALVDFYDDYVFGVAFKGNFLYVSLVEESVIIKYNWKYEAEPVLFTDRVITPGDIQLDAKGNLYVTELLIGDILKFNPTATSRKKIAWGFEEPFCLGLDKKGDIFVTDVMNYEVWKIRKK